MSTTQELLAAKERYDALVARIEALAEEFQSDDDEHVSAWGHHLPVGLGGIARLIRERLLADA